MPLNADLNKKEEKRDPKQEMLETILNNYGPHAAVTMEQAYKFQNKQLEDAMLGAGKNTTDIS